MDNACSGGLYAEIDIDTGILISKAVNYKNEYFTKHPDTGIILVGFHIPMWDSIKEFITEATKVVPEMVVIGWDVAVTPDGSTLIETNERPDLILLQNTWIMDIDKNFNANIKNLV